MREHMRAMARHSIHFAGGDCGQAGMMAGPARPYIVAGHIIGGIIGYSWEGLFIRRLVRVG